MVEDNNEDDTEVASKNDSENDNDDGNDNKNDILEVKQVSHNMFNDFFAYKMSDIKNETIRLELWDGIC